MVILLYVNNYNNFIFALQIVDSIISHGSFLTNCFIEHSVVGIRSRINSNAHLKVSFAQCYQYLLVLNNRPELQPGTGFQLCTM